MDMLLLKLRRIWRAEDGLPLWLANKFGDLAIILAWLAIISPNFAIIGFCRNVFFLWRLCSSIRRLSLPGWRLFFPTWRLSALRKFYRSPF
ncbi:hypothetical protein [Ureibacillus thermosphaericus]|uniref:hypothetical protein n=1 Tax=Ureibacillus thermosphaericus TaxID=51173 RepID=UPI0002EB0D2E|nr:hypothetical protein [Ureibacillus thermosphaericus]